MCWLAKREPAGSLLVSKGHNSSTAVVFKLEKRRAIFITATAANARTSRWVHELFRCGFHLVLAVQIPSVESKLVRTSTPSLFISLVRKVFTKMLNSKYTNGTLEF